MDWWSFFLLCHYYEWRIDYFRSQLKNNDNRVFVNEVQYHVCPSSEQVWFGYLMLDLQNEFAEVIVCVLIDSIEVLSE